MENLFVILILASLVLLVIGFISPQTSLFWYKKERTRKRSSIIYSITLITSFVLFGINSDNTKGTNTASIDNSTDSTTQTEQKTEEPNVTGVGQVLHTEYFDIIVNKVGIDNKVNTGNEFADLKQEDGNKYLIINASFKNTDNESRMLMEGSVWINYNGKDYEFDKAETIMLDGWGLLLDQINPLITKTTNLVYKIPAEIKGNIYWQPGRSNSDEKILLGNI